MQDGRPVTSPALPLPERPGHPQADTHDPAERAGSPVQVVRRRGDGDMRSTGAATESRHLRVTSAPVGGVAIDGAMEAEEVGVGYDPRT